METFLAPFSDALGVNPILIVVLVTFVFAVVFAIKCKREGKEFAAFAIIAGALLAAFSAYRLLDIASQLYLRGKGRDMSNNGGSRFASNLVAQFLLGIAISVMAAKASPPLTVMLLSFVTFLRWSVAIGLIYGFFRLFGARAEPLEWYFQHIPIGFPLTTRSEAAAVKAAPERAGARSDRDFEQRSGPEINWEAILSVNFVRYAGMLLIVSALFAFLFRIEWSLLYKIIACFVGGGLFLIAAEVALRKRLAGPSAIAYLFAFALVQFGLTLLCKHYLVLPDTEFTQARLWTVIKTVVSIVGVYGLLRYPASFAPMLYFLIAYLTPASLLRVVPEIPLDSALGFALVMSVLALLFGVLRDQYQVVLLNTFAANIYLLSQCEPTDVLWKAVRYATFSFPVEAGDRNLAVFVCLAIVFVIQTAAGMLYVLRHSGEGARPLGEATVSRRAAQEVPSSLVAPIFELFITQCLAASAMTGVQSNVQLLHGYYGYTLLGLALVTFGSFSLLRSRNIDNAYTEIVLNIALVMSAAGMFIHTKGAWTAIVFLLFSCVVIYISFVLGTFRTRAYAFVVLFASLCKLYFECSELFDSISGTSMVLIIGVILLFLSYKLDDIKTLLKKDAQPN